MGHETAADGDSAHVSGGKEAEQPLASLAGLAEALDSTQRSGDADGGTDGSVEVDWSSVPRYATVQCVRVSPSCHRPVCMHGRRHASVAQKRSLNLFRF